MKDLTKLLPLLIFALSLMISCDSRNAADLTSETHDKNIDSLVQAASNLQALERLSERFAYKPYGRMVVAEKMGLFYFEDGEYLESLSKMHEALEVAKCTNDTLKMGYLLNYIGTNYRRMSILDEAAKCHFEARSLSEQYSDSLDAANRKNLSMALNGLGNVYVSLGNNLVALRLFRNALGVEQSLGSDLGLAVNCSNIGNLFEDENKLDSARYYYDLAYKYNVSARSSLGISVCHENYGRLFFDKNMLDSAVNEYEKSYSIMLDSPDRWHWLRASLSLADVHIARGDLAAAKRYIDEAEPVAMRMKSGENKARIYELRYKYFAKAGDNKKALDYHIKSDAYADSVKNTGALNKIQNLRVSYEQIAKQQEINRLQQNYDAEVSKKRFMLTVLGCVIVLALAVIAVLWYVSQVNARGRKMLREMDETRTNFFTNITHEFRTPLTVILGLGRQLEQGGDSMPQGRVQELSGLIVRQGTNLLNLINQLLDISKVKSNVGEPDWRHGDVALYAKMIVDSLQLAAESKNITLKFDAKPAVIDIDFVPSYFEKVIGNLLTNALKFTPPGGEVKLNITCENDVFTIVVADNGAGMTDDDRKHIFEAFYQSKTSPTTAVGSGVGLSLVYQIVKVVHGKLDVESKLGEGSTFTIKIPVKMVVNSKLLIDAPLSTGELLVEGQSAEMPQGLDSDTAPTVLIVEDNADVAYYIGAQLQSHYQLVYAVNGKEGVAKAIELVPDLIITDLMMPEMDGYELCRSVRANEIVNHVPIIMITARSTDEDRIRGLEAGADVYLYKPFNSQELLVRVEHLLESRQLLQLKYSKALQIGETSEVQLPAEDQEFANRVMAAAESLLGDGDIDIETLAAKMCLSSRQLNRKLVALTGQSTISFVNGIRMCKAKQLLDSPENYSISDVARQCGFYDNAYFSRAFKRAFNITPSQYRKRES